MAVVAFDFAYWTALYPEFSAVSPAQGQAWFDRADLYFANDTTNPAYAIGASRFAQLLYLLTSHIAWMSAQRDAAGNIVAVGQAPTQVVGRISSASEGSVSVSTEWSGSASSPSEAWYLQTKYGADFWAATAQFRTFRYAAQVTIMPENAFPFGYFGGRGRVY